MDRGIKLVRFLLALLKKGIENRVMKIAPPLAGTPPLRRCKRIDFGLF